MKALFYRSTEIGEENIIWGLLELSIEAVKSENVVYLSRKDDDQTEIITKEISEGYDFVITRDFSVNVAEACYTAGTPYISWCYDSPVMALYCKEALYPTNYIFVFDRKHLGRLKDIGIKNVFYQPLAANMTKAELTVITPADIDRYACDVSFVGGMYDYGYYDRFKGRVNPDVIEECEGLFNRHMCRWDKDLTIFDELSDRAIEILYAQLDDNRNTDLSISNRYMTEILVLVYELTHRERFAILDTLGQKYNTVLNTRQPEKLSGKMHAKVCSELEQLGEELFKRYAAASVNLNLTMRSIESGVPQRIYDIMSVGGCVFSNYQEEAAELFEPDREIILFKSPEELTDKINYYLSHERERAEICINGHKKVKECYNYPKAIENMLSRL